MASKADRGSSQAVLYRMNAAPQSFPERVVGRPAFLVRHGDGAPTALVTALRLPDLVRRLVVAAGLIHHDGWAPGAIYLDGPTLASFIEFHGADSPDGPDAFPALNVKLDRMHEEEPTLSVPISGLSGPIAG